MAQVPANQPHHGNCNQAQNRDSGLTEDGNIFRERYNVDVPFSGVRRLLLCLPKK